VRNDHARSAEHMVITVERELLQQGNVSIGDVLGVVAGTQMASGSTNFMRLHTVTAEDVELVSRKAMRKARR